ncbi:hypothetical protein FRC03_006181 [Tulasnella sp. 419]|nr:hypothetical protein FRC03_006181 [Tulasnella sp. 419]
MKLVNSQLHRVISIAFTPDVAALRRYSKTLKLLQSAPILTEFRIKLSVLPLNWEPDYILNPIIAPQLKDVRSPGSLRSVRTHSAARIVNQALPDDRRKKLK